jgi:hypothetical protein
MENTVTVDSGQKVPSRSLFTTFNPCSHKVKVGFINIPCEIVSIEKYAWA